MANNSLSPRAQAEDEYFYRHNILGNMLCLFYFLRIGSIATSVQVLT